MSLQRNENYKHCSGIAIESRSIFLCCNFIDNIYRVTLMARNTLRYVTVRVARFQVSLVFLYSFRRNCVNFNIIWCFTVSC